MKIVIHGKHCTRCGKILENKTDSVCPIHIQIDKFNATRKYYKADFMFFGLHNKSTTEQIKALAIHWTHDSRIYLDLKKIFEIYTEDYVEIIIFCLNHEYMHRVITEIADSKTSTAFDCKYMRNMIDAYLGGIAP